MTPSADEGRKIAEKGAATIRNVMDKGEEVADQARRASEENYLIANESLRQFNLKFLERGGGSLLHVPLALSLTMLLNIFDVLIIEQGEVGPSFFVRTKELVELGVKSLGIAVFGSINEQRHQPRC
jgi:hypothetical protein